MATDLPHLTHPKYRPDIDGLRAVAVLSVVIYHAFPDTLQGGFVGVDVFFVISGFLISSIIFDNLEKGSFSFREFYARRIRRIFPALILVLTACGLYGWFVLLDDEFRQLGKHIAAGAGFVSNLVLWSEAGYFDRAAETKPLLHLWSLGIEEQFYIVWPLVLYLGFRRGVNLFWLALAVVALSFGLNIVSLAGEPEATFYSPVTRFWELLLGALLAYLNGHGSGDPVRQRHSTSWALPVSLRSAQSIIGGALIVAAVLIVNSERDFPGWWALMPTVGAYLIIASGPQAWFNRVVLSRSALVWVGLISYPLYLWHWPLLTFARIAVTGTPAPGVRIVLVLAAVVLAWLTYRLVEKPIRSGKRRNLLALGLCALMLAIGIAGYAGYLYGNATKVATSPALARGEARREAKRSVAASVPKPQFVDNQFAFDWPLFEERHIYAKQKKECREKLGVDVPYCMVGDVLAPPTVALIGDSHAPRLFAAVGAAVGIAGGNVMAVGKDGCGPYLGVERDQNGCPRTMQRVVDFIARTATIKTVVITGRFSAALSGTDLASVQPTGWFSLMRVDRPEITDRAAILELGLEDMLDKLTAAGKKVILIHENPELAFDPRSCLPERGGKDCRMTRKAVDERQADYRRLMARILARYPAVEQLDVLPYFCSNDECIASSEGFILYSDNHHLGPNGSAFLVNSRFPADLAKLLKPQAYRPAS